MGFGDVVQSLPPTAEGLRAWFSIPFAPEKALHASTILSAEVKALVAKPQPTAACTVDDVRAEGWWFMLGGGAGFIHLNGEYYRGQETGGSDTQTRIVPEKGILKDFMESLDLVGLRCFNGLGGIPAGAIASAIAEPGRQYAVYLFHDKNDGQWGAHYVVTPGKFEDTLALTSVPSGEYGLEWIDPATGKVKRTESRTHSGGSFQVAAPPYTMDVALRMRRSAAPAK